MIQLVFDGTPDSVRSGCMFVTHVLTVDEDENPSMDYEDYVHIEIVQGVGRLGGGMTEVASGGQADFFLTYEGKGPLRLQASAVGSRPQESASIEVIQNDDELAADRAIDDPKLLEQLLSAMDNILAQQGSTTQEASEITEWMLLGGKPAAEAAMRSNAQKVTHILNCCEPWCAGGPNEDAIEYKGFEAYDEPGYRLLEEHYDTKCKPFLDSVRSTGGRCLVHCAMGVNRSALVCAAYLVDVLDMDVLDAVQLLKDKRGCVLGNHSFRLQLIEFAAQRGRLGSIQAS